MLIVIVDVFVRPEAVTAFATATRKNAECSVKEPGVVRFDVLVDQADPTHFQLIEAYRDPDAPARHKETPHYQTWRDTVEAMMQRPRSSTKFENVFPGDDAY